MQKAILGMDTSNYMTSLCLLDCKGGIIRDEREFLPVKKGEQGLQQSEASFHHIKQLPRLMDKLSFMGLELEAVSVSTAPRPVAGSYMPVFKVGEGFARTIALSHRIPCYCTSHQEGHIAAGEFSASQGPEGDHFVAAHLSGGTSEILDCRRTETGYEIEKIGGSTDLYAGQFIERVGGALGLPFMAGPHLEKLARQSQNLFSVPSSVKEYNFSFSGPETALLRAVEEKKFPLAELARAAEKCIANTMEKVLRRVVEKGMSKEILIVGGVAANQYIRGRLNQKLQHPAVGAKLYYGKPEYSGDNAFGVASIGRIRYLQDTNIG